MHLELVSPDKVYFEGEVSKVNLPGVLGKFTVLHHHAPIVSLLENGSIIYEANGEEKQLEIISGLAEVKHDKIVVCIDKLAEQDGKQD